MNQDVSPVSTDELEDELSLWLREPENPQLSKEIISGHLCSCDGVCVAVVDDSID